MTIANLETITDTQSWCRTWPPNGSRHIRSKQKLHKKPRDACKSFSSSQKSRKSFTLTIPWNSAKLVKIFPGIIARSPHRSETNGIAGRAVRRVKEGTSAVLLQSGLNESWWADSMECYTYLRNVTDLLSDGKTPYERRFGQPFKGPIMPFGSLVEYHPRTAKDQSRIHQFGKKVLPGLFFGYALYAGRNLERVTYWLQTLRSWRRWTRQKIYSKRLNAKEVLFPKGRRRIYFPITDGRIKTLGGDQDLRTSTLVRHRLIQGESNIDFLGESEGSLPPPQDSFPDAGEAVNDFWSMSGSFMYRHHVEPRVKLYSPRDESFPIPLKYIDVSRTTHTNLDVKQEKRIDDYWELSMGHETCQILGQVSHNLLY